MRKRHPNDNPNLLSVNELAGGLFHLLPHSIYKPSIEMKNKKEPLS